MSHALKTQRSESVSGSGRQPISISKVWILLPAYNEQDAIERLIQNIVQVKNKEDLNIEIVVVDDASTDQTGAIVSRCSFSDPVHLIQHRRNQGLAGALRTGFEHILNSAQVGDVIVTLDADETHPPAAIPRMLEKISEGYEVVIASRFQNGSRAIGVPTNRRIMTAIAKWMFKSIAPIPGVWDYTCGFRAYRFEALRQTAEFHGVEFVSESGFSCMADVLLKMRRFRFVMGEVPFLLRYDQKKGPSKMRVTSTAIQTVKLIIRRRLGV